MQRRITLNTLLIIFIMIIALFVSWLRINLINSYGGFNSLLPVSSRLTYNPLLYDSNFPLWPDEITYLNSKQIHFEAVFVRIQAVFRGEVSMLNLFSIFTSFMTNTFGYISVLLFSLLSLFIMLIISARICRILNINMLGWLVLVVNPSILLQGASFMRDIYITTGILILVLALLDKKMSRKFRVIIAVLSFLLISILRLHYVLILILVSIGLSKTTYKAKITMSLVTLAASFMMLATQTTYAESQKYTLRLLQTFFGIAYGAWTRIGDGFLFTVEGLAWLYYFFFSMLLYLRLLRGLWKKGKFAFPKVFYDFLMIFLFSAFLIFMIYFKVLGAYPFRVFSPSWAMMVFALLTSYTDQNHKRQY